MRESLGRRALAGGAALVMMSAVAAAETRYLESLPEVPVMSGLHGVPERGMRFDKPGGRIARAVARGEAEASEVRRFYRRTLPQLGWRRIRRDTYARAGEVLRLRLHRDAGGLTVRFRVEPR